MKNVMNTPQPYLHRLTLLGLTTAIVTAGGLMPIRAQDCALVNGEIPEQCTHANAGHTVAMPTQPNVELEDIPDLGVDGFEISVDGDPVSLDGVVQKQRNTISAKKRRQDIALAQASVAVKFDGLDVRPRLDAHLEQTGNVLRFQNQMNYPAFVRRGEVRIIDTSGRGGAKTVAIIPLNPNAQTSVTRPAGDGLQYVYRVYDARGRFDETAPASLDAPARRGDATDVEQGTDSAALRNIPVFGGAVTVSGRDLRGGANVSTLGETLRADPNGTFVIQRILPTGDHMVDVDVAGGPNLSRDIDVPASDLFYIGLIDVTLGKTLSNDLEDATGDDYDKFYNKGRIAFYLKGKIKGDYLLTAAADTGEDELKNLLRNFDEKDPTSLLDRIDPNEYYPVYGDDSTSEIDAPTSGKFYIKLEKDTSHAMWGNFKSAIEGTEYLRNERTLYGAQGVYNSNAQTNNGDARVSVQLHAAQPETLPQRDSFLGTGGSTYFLKFQDISQGSETILIEVQNSTTGQVIERRTLVYGIDYDINYVQGLVILKSPLSGSAGNSDLIVNNPNGDNNVHLIVNYEHTPTSVDVDSYSYGGRGQFWVNDKLRVGVTAQDEDLGTSEQTAYGVDMLYRHSEQTYAELEYAKTSGVGSGENRSVDGGLTFGDIVGVDGEGRAIRFKGQLDLADINADYDGLIGGYFEDRSAGFSTLNYRTDNDERLWGIHADFAVSERARVRLEYDDYHDSTGKTLREGGATLAFQKTDAVLWEFGVEHVEKNTPSDPDETGERTDIGVRLTYEPNDRYKVYGFAQASLRHEGGLDKNNRVGFGGAYQLNDHWRLSGEISDGSTGVGARALAQYDRDENNSYYFGYTLDPDREFGGNDLVGRDKGSFVAGARRRLNDSLTVYGENTYDLFGVHRSLTSTYGADYIASDFLTFTGGFEFGRVRDSSTNTEFDRKALSLGSIYRDEDLSLRTRLEYRKDEGLESGQDKDADTIAANLTARYKISDNARLLFSAEAIQSENASASIPDAKFVEITTGYAFRPVEHDRLNVLAKYSFLYDMTERASASTTNGANFDNSPRQKAHIFSLDASYDINRQWTLGGKIGARFSEQDNGDGFVSNNATLGVVNLRYHIVHKWDALVEYRQLHAQDIGTDTGVTTAIYRHVGNNMKIGAGYNFGKFSDDLRDVTYNDKGAFINIIAKF